MISGTDLLIKRIITISSLVIISLSAAAIHTKPVIEESTVHGIEMVLVPAGSFTMGKKSPGSDYSPEHTVTLSAFRISKYEVSQRLYAEITGDNPCEGSKYGDGENRPVFNISWYEAVEFCNRLSRSSGLKPYYKITKEEMDTENMSEFDTLKWEVSCIEGANGFRLPTEAQWEYACRAGTKTDYYWGKKSTWDTSGRYSWHLFNSGVNRRKNGTLWWAKFQKVKECGTKKPNKFSLYDMCGNVSEWCYDRYNADYYKSSEKNDPAGYDGNFPGRVFRGGSILDSPVDFASYKRWVRAAFEKQHITGIRLVLPR